MKVFICGASGLLGRGLCSLLSEKGIDYLGSYNINPISNAVKIDFSSLTEIENIFNQYKPTVCVNCLVQRQVDICENDWNEIKKINVDYTNNIAKICSKHDIILIHISTDYVFDGLSPPYYPNSLVNPLQNYGISKLLSEYKIQSKCTRYYIIRVPVLYSDDIKYLSENAVSLIGKKVLNRIEISKEDNYSIRRPNYIPDFCYFITDIIIGKISEFGIYHFYNPYEKTTKYQISNLICNILNKKNNIIAIDNEPCDAVERPKDTQLMDTKYDINNYKITNLMEGLERCFKHLYHPHLTDSKYHSDLLFLIDLDGTLVDTDVLHYQCYQKAIKEYISYDLSYGEYLDIIDTIGIDDFLNKKTIEMKDKIKIKKNELFKKQDINWIKNADKFLDYLINNDISYCIITNTSQDNVNYMKSKLEILNKVKHWIVREDYIKPKPSSECYEKAINLLGNKKYIIGIENSLSGYLAIKQVLKCIYILTNKSDKNYKYFTNEDVYLINDYDDFFNNFVS